MDNNDIRVRYEHTTDKGYRISVCASHGEDGRDILLISRRVGPNDSRNSAWFIVDVDDEAIEWLAAAIPRAYENARNMGRALKGK